MDKSFSAVVSLYKPVVELTHQQQVLRLYRKSLRTVSSWCEDRDVFNYETTEIRKEFNENKNIPVGSAKLTRIMREAKDRLEAQTHPDPYIQAYMPGGSLFMRNPAFPNEALYPDGVPSFISKRRINIDMSNIPDSQEYANKVFVDSANKAYWIDK